jgi:hypothetical protein
MLVLLVLLVLVLVLVLVRPRWLRRLRQQGVSLAAHKSARHRTLLLVVDSS